ncbi:MAG: hypothetical protein RR482_03785, partial [Clostridia bacterium]
MTNPSKGKRPLTRRQQLLLVAMGALILLLVLMIILLGMQQRGRDPFPVAAVFPASGRISLQTGGQASVSVNLSTIWVEAQGEDTRIQMELLQVDANGQPVAATGMPRYEVYLHTQPARLEVVLPTMTSWDYNGKLQLEGQKLVTGVFQHVSEQEAGGHIYFQLSQEASMTLVEENGFLNFVLTPKETPHAMCWRVVVNALNQIVETPLLRQLMQRGMTPTLCDDLTSTTMISETYATQREAQAFADSLRSELAEEMPGELPLVLSLQTNDMPPMRESADPALFSSTALFQPEDHAFSAKLMLHNAHIVAREPYGDDMLMMRRGFAQASGMANAEEAQTLMCVDDQGRQRALLDANLPAAADAKISPDGEWVALVKTTDTGRSLYIYRFQNGDLFSMRDQIGSVGIGYAWTRENKLYAMAGQDALSFYCIDPTLPMDDPGAVTLVDTQPGLDGELAGTDTLLYASDGYAQIYRCDPLIGTRTPFANGGNFSISPDGLWMLAYAYNDGEASDTQLKLIPMQGGAEISLVQTESITDFCWTSDGSAFYYLLRMGDNEQSELYRYT